jgi:amidase
LNPINLELTAGGSSGGEGALIAMRGSILGVATDIAGSIRIPALCCGLYGFKPSANRIPYGGQQPAGRPGSPGLIASAGPLATSFRDLEFFFKTVISKAPWDYDASALPIPWRSVSAKSKLVIGVLPEDPTFPLHPPVSRALATAIKKLEDAGHKIVHLTSVKSIYKSIRLCIDLFSLDNTNQTFKNIAASGEPLVPSVAGLVKLQVPREAGYTLEEMFDLNVARAQHATEWNDLWVEQKLDVIIGPGAETTAVPHDTYGNAPYTMLWSLLNVSHVY